MKKAKIKDGVVKYVWPNFKGKEMPPQHPKIKIEDVPDYVKPGMVWNGKAYVSKPKIPLPVLRDFMTELVCNNRDWSYEKCRDEAARMKHEILDNYKAAYKQAFEEQDEESMTRAHLAFLQAELVKAEAAVAVFDKKKSETPVTEADESSI